MLPLNPLYEVVPCDKELPPENKYHVVLEDGTKEVLSLFNGRWYLDDACYRLFDYPFPVTHYLRSLPPERMEEWVREIASKAWDESAKFQKHGSYVNVFSKSGAIDNLINEMSK